MKVYLFNILVLLAWAALLLWHRPDHVKKALFCAIATSQWIVVSGLRHPSVGADTYAYRDHFYRVLSTPWTDVMDSLWGTYFGVLGVKDPGYTVFVKTLQLITSDYQVYLVLVAAMFTIPLGVLIYRHSRDPFLSFLVYSTLFYSFFAITGTRQTIATALVVLLGYPLIVKRQLLVFLLLGVIAFTIHKSSVVFLPFYFLADLEVTRIRFGAALSAAVLVFVFREPVASTLAIASGYEGFASGWASTGAWTFSFALVAVLVAAAMRLSVILSAQPDARGWMNALFLGVVFTPLAFFDPSAMRVAQYFTLFLVFIVPALVQSFRDSKERALVYWAVISVMGLLFIQTKPQYLFFWQGP